MGLRRGLHVVTVDFDEHLGVNVLSKGIELLILVEYIKLIGKLLDVRILGSFSFPVRIVV